MMFMKKVGIDGFFPHSVNHSERKFLDPFLCMDMRKTVKVPYLQCIPQVRQNKKFIMLL